MGYRAVQVLRFIRTYIGDHGFAPSYSEIMDGVGIHSKGEVSRIVQSLERRALVNRVGKGRVRRIRLNEARISVQSSGGAGL